MTFQELIDAIESLTIEDQDYLFELIRKRRIEKRRDEIAANAKEVFKAVEMGTDTLKSPKFLENRFVPCQILRQIKLTS